MLSVVCKKYMEDTSRMIKISVSQLKGFGFEHCCACGCFGIVQEMEITAAAEESWTSGWGENQVHEVDLTTGGCTDAFSVSKFLTSHSNSYFCYCHTFSSSCAKYECSVKITRCLAKKQKWTDVLGFGVFVFFCGCFYFPVLVKPLIMTALHKKLHSCVTNMKVPQNVV